MSEKFNSKAEEIKKLTEYLNKCRDDYYNCNKSPISDQKYDEMYDKLAKLEDETGVSFTNSPTKTVGFEVKSELKKTKHSHPMLSLDKTKSVDELIKFAGNKDCILSCKMDGLTVLLTYDNGELIKAETRGNGIEGELITSNAKMFENIPLTIPYKGLLEVEGEAIIPYDVFVEINSKLPEDKKYKNPRNLASGSVRQLDNRITKERHVHFIAWKVPTEIDDKDKNNSFLGRLIFVKQLGFGIVPLFTYVNNSSDKKDLPKMIESLKQMANDLNYGIDGLVMTYNDITYGESLGMTGHHPKHSIAYKFYDEEETTTLKSIEWSMGKSGVLTPVAIFEPVEIDGTTVERASLHNISVMNELSGGFERIGDILTIFKANQIIPQVRTWTHTGEYSEERHLSLPTECPVCGAKTEIKKDNDTKILICTNPSCKGKLLGKLTHFVSKKAMNIDGLSEETLKKFIDLGWLNSISDIYDLPEHLDELSRMDGFGKKSVQKLAESIEKSKDVDLQHFIVSLSIPNIGTAQSKILAKEFKTWDVFYKAVLNDYDFTRLDSFGYTLHNNIYVWFASTYTTDKIEKLLNKIRFKTENNTNKESNLLQGKTYVITGSLEHFKNRSELQAFIESLGGKVSGSVSKNTTALINNDINSNSSKNKKARDLGVMIISEKDFVEFVNSAS